MYEVAKHEFSKWLNSYKSTHSLSQYEINILNVIIDNFESIASKGTASGSRANFIVAKISGNNYTPCQNPLTIMKSITSTSSKIERLQELKVEAFRGFSTFLSFDFSKQYSSFFGTNGSGKSSLCEALEYCILGTIQEASTRRIPLETFVKNKKKNKFTKPELIAIINGQKEEVKSNLDAYRFTFIEKNRIDNFSHIGAMTPSEKNERLAILFGLYEFTNFVKGFTDSLDNKINLDNTKSQSLDEKEKIEKQNIIAISTALKKIDGLKKRINEKILEINNPTLHNINSAINFLQSADGNGKIKELEQLLEKNKKIIYSLDYFSEISPAYTKLTNEFKKLNTAEAQLLSLAVNTNMASIYDAVSKLTDDIDHSVCPVCKTPITKTTVNPFENAKEELAKLEKFTSLKDSIKDFQRKLLISAKELNSLIEKNSNLLIALGYNPSELILPIPDNATDFSNQVVKNSFTNAINKIAIIEANAENDSQKIQEINKTSEEHNSNNEYTIEITRLRRIYSSLIEFKGSLKTSKDEALQNIKSLKEFKKEKRQLKEDVIKEKETNSNKQEFKNAYKKIVEDLNKYQKELPSKMAQNLSSKIKEYYNIMNQGDADYEMINELKMPANSNDYISIKFKDGIDANALQVLSEGHVKLLGLAILLAKANNTNQNFIILDDIVNAIDDDHRSGVASLLFEHKDFENTQIILTCHSEPFIKKVEDTIPVNVRDKKITRYVFLAPFNEDSRGIVVDYSNPKEPLELAKIDISKGDIKDAAQKCRQAIESITNKLWKKLSNTYNIQISVALNSPKGIPELSSVIDGIAKHMKKYLSKDEPVLQDLQKLQSNYNKYIMNKGTHYEEDQFQLELNDVKNLYELLLSLDQNINNLQLKKVTP